MSWIKMAVAGIALCAGAQVASAQAPQGPPQGPPGAEGQRPNRGMQMLFEGITLTDAQQKQIQDINDKYRAQMRALMPEGGFQAAQSDPKMRDKFEDIREKQMKEIKAVLTHDQQEIFDKNVDAAKKRREEMRKNGGNGQ